MDLTEKYKVRESVRDAIRILDSAPVKPDLKPEAVIVQLTNRVPVAHLAIERALKALVAQGGGAKKRTHSLDNLYKALRSCDQESAMFLSKAFDDAVGFFNLSVGAEGFGHFQNLESYLSKVGGGKAFQTLRYWPIEEHSDGDSPIPFVWLPIHREVLCALTCLFSGESKVTVVERVECEVANRVSDIRAFSELQNSKLSKESLTSYKDWLARKQGTFRHELKQAFRNGFVCKSHDNYWSLNLRAAFNDLKMSEDPAVKYLIETFSYLPKGSQTRDPNAIPVIEWLNDLNRNGFVETPTGFELGYIERYADGAWGISPSETGWVKVTETAECLEDAKHYLVNRITKQISVTVNGNPKKLRIVSEPHSPESAEWTPDEEAAIADKVFELIFWDSMHGIEPGDRISLEIPSQDHPTRAMFYVGSVTDVVEHEVSIEGNEVLGIAGEFPQ